MVEGASWLEEGDFLNVLSQTLSDHVDKRTHTHTSCMLTNNIGSWCLNKWVFSCALLPTTMDIKLMSKKVCYVSLNKVDLIGGNSMGKGMRP